MHQRKHLEEEDKQEVVVDPEIEQAEPQEDTVLRVELKYKVDFKFDTNERKKGKYYLSEVGEPLQIRPLVGRLLDLEELMLEAHRQLEKK